MLRFLHYGIVLLLAQGGLLFGQYYIPHISNKNLVPNSSFENYRRKGSNIRFCTPWQGIATVDFYQEPVKGDTTVERGAKTGDCYAGLRYQKRYKEFLQVKLVEPLKRGCKYEVKVYFRLAHWSNVALKSLGVLFSKGGYAGQGSVSKPNMIDTVVKKKGLINGYRWFLLRGIYKADGGEKYMTIGNFHPVIRKDMENIRLIRFGFREAYYYVDDVSVVMVEDAEEKPEIVIVGPSLREKFEKDSIMEVNEEMKVGKKIALKNIFFAEGKSYFLPESYVELNKLSYFLIKNPDLVIQINGHSDNSGLWFKNQKLSEKRARAVFEYLIQRGVQNKMSYKGFGSSQPIADNSTDEGKAKNRRVEIEIIKIGN
ncbi:MAG: OmpA family protein [Bacteroidia bacterium]|nr:OmpA family protein [Bacteroidia bacterium]